ncbi:hypothetical protein QDY72_04205 [Kingella negevensis]|uniref:hypothetical protein n=1 Tax=Kingella negevensis TaxID=1522312 RepID=UPI00254D69D0|nr:hypothetical protein [Kingella negevensis]MDK4684387.1 hypothetical protein [Kingella negevensis]MDK4709938.1 hypothetical protein [Kingella negevensis]
MKGSWAELKRLEVILKQHLPEFGFCGVCRNGESLIETSPQNILGVDYVEL